MKLNAATRLLASTKVQAAPPHLKEEIDKAYAAFVRVLDQPDNKRRISYANEESVEWYFPGMITVRLSVDAEHLHWNVNQGGGHLFDMFNQEDITTANELVSSIKKWAAMVRQDSKMKDVNTIDVCETLMQLHA